MSNPGLRLTNAGREILAHGLAGDEIHFTKVAYGDADFDYETESLADLTELKSWKLDLPIIDKQVPGDGTCVIVALCTNFNLEHGFRAKEIGVFAIDQTTGDEVLYAYRNAGDEYNFIPAKTGVVVKAARYAYRVEVNDAPNITFNIDFSFAYVSQEKFEEHECDYNLLKSRVIELYKDKLIPSAAEIDAIIAGTYISSGETGEGELNGVPTDADIDAIINGTYTHHDPPTDGIEILVAPTDDEVDAIISGTYGGI